MPGGHNAFFGLVRTPLVRHGQDEKHAKGGHTFLPVHTEMLYQVCRDYPGLPDPRTLRAFEIRFFYEGLRGELRHHTGGKKG